MEWLGLDHGDVVEHGSHGVHMREAARVQAVDEFAVHLVQVAPGGALGRHPTRLWQLFCVASGSGWVSGADGRRHDITAGEAVMWAPGEEHESGSDAGMTALVTQAAARLPYG